MNTCSLELSLSENPSPNTCRENKSESVTVIVSVSVSANGTIGVQSKSCCWFSWLSCCWLSFQLVSAIMSDSRFGVCGAEAVLAPAEVTLSSC